MGARLSEGLSSGQASQGTIKTPGDERAISLSRDALQTEHFVQ